MSWLAGVITLAAIAATPQPGAARGGALLVQHQAAPCAVAGRHVRIEARVSGETSAAEVFFHGAHDGAWYAVAMRLQEGVWTASLPRPEELGSRFAYFVSAFGPSKARGRLPERSAFLVDVAESCPDGGLPTSEEGPEELRVPPGAPPVPLGFSRQGIGSYLESIAAELPRPAAAASLLVPPLSHVRIMTVEPSRWLEGEVTSQDEDGLALRVRGESVRVSKDEIARVEVRQRGSNAMAAVGALAGATAGFVGALLVCVSADDFCDSTAPLWVGTGLGLVAGAAAGGAPDWRSATLLQKGHFSLALQRRGKSAALGVRVRF